MNSISLCMMVKDEAVILERALNCVYGYVAEMIIIDTGSTDHTVEIAKGYDNAKVFEEQFPDPPDFSYSDVRNLCIERASCEWILSLDADELFPQAMMRHLPMLMGAAEYDAYQFARQNYIDGVLQNLTNLDCQVRLFKNYCRWEGRLHEHLEGYKSLATANFTIQHLKTPNMQALDNAMYYAMGQRL